MKKIFAVLGMLLLFISPVMAQEEGAAPAAPAAPVAKKVKKAPAANDERGIKKAFGDFAAAWGSGDARKLGAFFTPDSSFNSMGGVVWGKKDIVKALGAELKAAPGTTMSFDNFTIVFLMSNIAMVDVDETITGLKNFDGTEVGPSKRHLYVWAVNRSGDWQARAVRGASVTKATEAPATAPASSVPAAAAPSAGAPALKPPADVSAPSGVSLDLTPPAANTSKAPEKKPAEPSK